jgi:hypothetical protein
MVSNKNSLKIKKLNILEKITLEGESPVNFLSFEWSQIGLITLIAEVQFF